MGYSKSENRSGSYQTTSASDSVWGPQIGALQQLYGRGLYRTNVAQTAGLNDVSGFAPTEGLIEATQRLSGLTNTQGQIAAQTNSLQQGLGNLFRDEILPSIKSNTIGASGTLGTGREGVATGVAAGQLGQAFQEGLGDIVAQANQTAIGAGGMIGNLFGLQQGAAMDRFNATQQSYLGPLQALAGIIGAPTTLRRQEGYSQSRGKATSGGFEFPGFGGS